jgi:hypothetical protein
MLAMLLALTMLCLAACGPGDPQAGPTPTPTIVAGGGEEEEPEGEPDATAETWDGTWDSDEPIPGCPGEAHGAFTMIVDAQGTLSGQGTYDRTNCGGSFTDQAFLIEGQRTDSTFHIVFPGGIPYTPEFDAPIVDGTATGTWDDRYQHWVVNVTCKTNCPGER